MLFLSIIFAHLLSEFLFNPAELSVWKNKGYPVLLVSSVVVFIIYSAVLFFITSMWAVIAIIAAIVHLFFNYLSKKTKLEFSDFEIKAAFPLFLTKQFLQVVILVAVSVLLGLNLFSESVYAANLFLLIDSLLLVTIFASYLIDSISRQIAGSIKREYKIEGFHRIVSLTERGVLFLVLLYNFYYFIPIVFVPRIFIQRIKILTKYRTEFLIGTAFTVMVFVFFKSAV